MLYRERIRGRVVYKGETGFLNVEAYDIFNKHVIGVAKVYYRDFEIEEKQKAENEKDILRTKITFEELKAAAQPLIELLRKKGHPHMTVLVTDDSIKLVETLMGIPMPYED